MESTATPKLGKLYIAATPIGHLADATQRLREILLEVDEVLAEDTRHCRRLFDALGVSPRVSAYHEHNERERCETLIERLQKGQSFALISDAGTPLINDPGYRIVAACHRAEVPVVPVPGACAAVAALSVSGLPTDRFCYEGFLPNKSAARCQRLQALAGESATLVFYESSHRIVDTLRDMQQVLGSERRIALCREMTKRYETVVQKSAAELLAWVQADPNQQRGEFVLVVAGAEKGAGDGAAARQAMQLLLQELPPKRAAVLCAKLYDVDKREAYRIGLEIKAEQGAKG